MGSGQQSLAEAYLSYRRKNENVFVRCMEDATVSIPELLLATYEIQREIAHGGMSRLYLAKHRRLNTFWVVKEVCRADFPAFDLLAEANILKRLHHPMLPHIADVFETPDAVYLVEEYVEGENLQQVVRTEGPLQEETVRQWALSLCDVLDYLHSHTPPIIYRDMKPSNVMRQPDGTLKLVDFGIARVYKRESLSDTTFAGTRGYAAPEQFSGRQTDQRTDIYALGVTLYYLLTGKGPADQPYEMVPLRQRNSTVSPSMESIVAKCTRLEPEDRYQDVRQLQADLRMSTSQKAHDTRQKYTWRIVGGILVLLLAGGGFFAFRYGKSLYQKKMDTLYSDALVALNESDAETAIEKLNDLLNMDPQRSDAYLALGNAYLEQARALELGDDRAESLCEQARSQYEKAQEMGNGDAQAQIESLQQFEEENRRFREQMDLLSSAYDTIASRDWDAIKELLMQPEYQQILYRGQTNTVVYDDSGENVLALYPLSETAYADRIPGFYYYGTMEDNQRTGTGLWYYIDNQNIYYYDGAWKNDLPNGSGTVYVAPNLQDEETNYGAVQWEQSTGNFVDGYFDGMFHVVNKGGDGVLLDMQIEHNMGYHVPIPYDDLPAYCQEVLSRQEFQELEASGYFVQTTCIGDDGYVNILYSTPEDRCMVMEAHGAE